MCGEAKTLKLAYRLNSVIWSMHGIIAFAFLVIAFNASPLYASNPSELQQSTTIQQEISGKQKYSYRINIAEGDFVNAIVEQRGIDVVTQWIDKNGNLISEFDNELRLYGAEKIFVVAEMSGTYSLEVEAKFKRDRKGSYEVRIIETRKATDQEKLLHEAIKNYTNGYRFYDLGKYDEAVAHADRAVNIYQDLIPDSIEMARSLYNAGRIWQEKEDYAKAALLFNRAVEIGEKILDQNDPELARFLAGLGRFYAYDGDIPKAEALYNRALQIHEKILGKDHPEVARVLDFLASLAENKGEYVASVSFCKQALSALEISVERDDPAVAWPLHDLAFAYWRMGDFGNALSLYQQALEIREKNFGADHPLVGNSAFGVATVLRALGDLKKSEAFHLRALEIRKRVYGPESWRVAGSLNNLAVVYEMQDELDKAETMYLSALAIWEKMKSQELNTSYPLQNLSIIYHQKNDLEKAEAYLRRALEIRERILGSEHPRVADLINNLGNIYRSKNDFNKALELHMRALSIWEKTVGSWYPDNILALTSITADYILKGEIDNALKYQSRAESVVDHTLALNIATGSERQRLAYQEKLAERTNQTITLHVSFARDNSAASELALTAILQRKGRVLDSLMNNITALRSRLLPADRQLIDGLNETTTKLANLVLDGPQDNSLDSHEAQIRTLEQEREKLENEIAIKSAGFYQTSKPVSIDAIRSAIPANAALIEFVSYRPFDPKGKRYTESYEEPHYVAYILRSEGNVSWKELGKANVIDESIAAAREALRDPKRNDVRNLSRAIDEKIMRPLRPFLSDVTQLLISTDGALSLVPFEVMVDENGKYLIEQFSFSYLTSGRDLLRLQFKRESKSKPIVVAAPFFGEPNATKLAKNSSTRVTQNRRSVTTGSEITDVYFAPIAGTAQEANAIKVLFPETDIATGPKATESMIKNVTAPRILHIATHGFFLTDASSGSMGGQTRGFDASLKIENPLLRSGLALAHANLQKNKEDDGIFTALEVSGLDLWGTKLAVLSACDTGLGEVKNGEGVYGLRRAFVLAGVESLVMSLWAVSDFVTREMMTNYYQGLKQNLGRGESLRQVKLNMLKRKGRQHPFYWASFIQLGEWANLEGER